MGREKERGNNRRMMEGREKGTDEEAKKEGWK